MTAVTISNAAFLQERQEAARQLAKQKGDESLLELAWLQPGGAGFDEPSLEIEVGAAKILLGDQAAKFLGIGLSDDEILIAEELEHGGFWGDRLEAEREKLAKAPDGSTRAVFARYHAGTGKLKSLCTLSVGPNCKHKRGDDVPEFAANDPRNAQACPRLVFLGYVNPTTGVWQESMP